MTRPSQSPIAFFNATTGSGLCSPSRSALYIGTLASEKTSMRARSPTHACKPRSTAPEYESRRKLPTIPRICVLSVVTRTPLIVQFSSRAMADDASRRIRHQLQKIPSADVDQRLVVAPLEVRVRHVAETLVEHHVDPVSTSQGRYRTRLAVPE